MPDLSTLDADERSRILAKLAKLKALSECPTGNVNETATAAAAMIRLMAEYRIDMAELCAPAALDPVSQEQVSSERGRGFPGWQNHLLATLAEANDCIGYEHRERDWDPFWGAQLRVRQCILGDAQDIQHVKLIYNFCLSEIERLCYLWAPNASVARKNDFRQGAAMAVGTKVQREKKLVRAEEEARAKARGQQSRALARLDQRAQEVQRKASEIGLRAGRPTQSRPMRADAFHAGYAAGESLQLPGGQKALTS